MAEHVAKANRHFIPHLPSNIERVFDLVLCVHLFDQLPEQLIDVRPLDLAGGSGVTVFGHRLLWKNPEFLHLLDPGEAPIVRMNFAGDQLYDLSVLRQTHMSGIGNLTLTRPLRDVLEIDLEEGGHLSAWVSEHNVIAERGTAAQSISKRGGGNVLAATGDEDVLLAIDDPKAVVGVGDGDIA